jgi:hypothetical protein
MKESTNTQKPLAPPVPQHALQHYFKSPPLMILKNPIPHQGVMNSKQKVHPAPPQMGKYQN